MGLHSRKYKEFLRRLKQAREESGLAQAEVAKKLGKHQSYVSKCEQGERRVDFTELEEFAAVYGKPLTWFSSREKRRSR